MFDLGQYCITAKNSVKCLLVERTVTQLAIKVKTIVFFFLVNDLNALLLDPQEIAKISSQQNFSHLEPQKVVPTKHEKSPIRKIKLPQKFHATEGRFYSSLYVIRTRNELYFLI